jgi:2-haloacid dehalogenase
MRLSNFTVLTFDCYGTLIDWESGIAAALQGLARHAGGRPRDELLESFARHEAAQEAETPKMLYSDLLAQVHRRLARDWGVIASEEEHRAFSRSIGEWPPFPDSPDALRYLKGFYKLVILSNVDRASFMASEKRLGISFDRVFTAEEIGSYKPDPRNFRHMLDALRAEGHDGRKILHVAQSLYHDHMPANALGLASAWIDRRHGEGWGATPPPPPGVHYDFRFASLADLVAAHRAEREE